jgi:hypothetical protein
MVARSEVLALIHTCERIGGGPYRAVLMHGFAIVIT